LFLDEIGKVKGSDYKWKNCGVSLMRLRGGGANRATSNADPDSIGSKWVGWDLDRTLSRQLLN
jgi:hypothetical protein